MAKLELYDYDIGMYRNVGYKCSNCGVEFGNNYFCSHFNGTPNIRKRECAFYKGW